MFVLTREDGVKKEIERYRVYSRITQQGKSRRDEQAIAEAIDIMVQSEEEKAEREAARARAAEERKAELDGVVAELRGRDIDEVLQGLKSVLRKRHADAVATARYEHKEAVEAVGAFAGAGNYPTADYGALDGVDSWTMSQLGAKKREGVANVFDMIYRKDYTRAEILYIATEVKK